MQSVFMKWFWAPLAIPLLLVVPNARAQTSIRVAVVDGNTGKPISNARVSVMIVRNFLGATVNAVNDGDKYLVQVQPGDTLVLGNVTKSDRSWNEYKLCAAEQDSKPTYSAAVILSRGLQAPNNCNKRITDTPVPGEVVFFVSRLSFLQRYRPFLD
jgi:hypothetical protein